MSASSTGAKGTMCVAAAGELVGQISVCVDSLVFPTAPLEVATAASAALVGTLLGDIDGLDRTLRAEMYDSLMYGDERRGD